MKLEQQVSSLELSKRLRELGVGQESYFSWFQGGQSVWQLGDQSDVMNFAVDCGRTTSPQFNSFSAFTVAELGEMLQESDYDLPWFFKHEETYPDGAWHWSTMSEDSIEMTEADARAKMLIYILENNLLANPL